MKLPATAATIIGPRNELMALMNCPRVRDPVSLSPLTTLITSGFRETCRRVFPIPRSVKASMTETNEYDTAGTAIAMTVTAKLNSTVFFLPILFISMPVGTDSSRNHRKHERETRPDTVSLIPVKSFLI